MRLRTDRLKVTIPGTISGFGLLGDALALSVGPRDEVTLRGVAGASQVRIIDQTPRRLPEYWLKEEDVENHPTIVAVRRVLDEVGSPQIGIHLTYRQGIPRDAGLGEFEAEVLAGILGAWTLLGKPVSLTPDILFALSGDQGLSPSRARASLEGGLVLTVAGAAENDPDTFEGVLQTWLRLTPGTSIKPVAFIPNMAYPPEPAGNARLDSAATQSDFSRVAALLTLLTQSLEEFEEAADTDEGASRWKSLMALSTVDHPRVDETQEDPSRALTNWLHERGDAAFLSGAGPAVVTLWHPGGTVREDAKRAGWTVLDLPVDLDGLLLDV